MRNSRPFLITFALKDCMNSLIKIFVLALFLSGCNNAKLDSQNTEEAELGPPRNIQILALGDSYTIGESVCDSCRFPEQLKQQIKNNLSINDIVSLDIIARTGWTTSDLKLNINQEDPTDDNDLVTLLIGVNNQYQNASFSLYEAEFPELVTTAIRLAKNDKSNVIVVSIPDYAFTPFGQNTGTDPQTISDEIDQYNAFAKNYCLDNDIAFVNITPISREGLTNPDLVANDQLHPSELAYARFVDLILPVALEKL